jgi:hypothetical protein
MGRPTKAEQNNLPPLEEEAKAYTYWKMMMISLVSYLHKI